MMSKVVQESNDQSIQSQLSAMFERENLSENDFLIYKMDQNLKIPIEFVFKNIYHNLQTQMSEVELLEELKQVKNVQISQDNKFLKPVIQQRQDKLIINQIFHDDQESFKNFISEQIKDCKCDIKFDRHNCCRLIFDEEEDALNFHQWIQTKQFKEKPINSYFEPENVYLSFLHKANEKSKINGFGHESHDFFYQSYQRYYKQISQYQSQFQHSYQKNFNFYIRRANDHETVEGNEEKQQSKQLLQYPGMFPMMFGSPMMMVAQNLSNQAINKDKSRNQPRGKNIKRNKSRQENEQYIVKEEQEKKEEKKEPKEVRARINSDNFPSLSQQVHDVKIQELPIEAPIVKYTKNELLEIFKQCKEKLTIPSHLLKLEEKSIPIVEKTKQSLESLESTKIPVRKESSFSSISRTPKLGPANPNLIVDKQ